MLDRHGQPIRIGFQAHELEYITAAMTLPLRERESAYDQISDLTGRAVSSIKNRARKLITEKRQRDKAFLEVALRKAWASETVSRRTFVTVPTLTREKQKAAA